jgi:autotransporter-associated beta strand protein
MVPFRPESAINTNTENQHSHLMKPRHYQANLLRGTVRASFTMQPVLRNAVLSVGLALLPLAGSQAQSTGTWNPTPTTGLTWNTAANWTSLTGGQVPNAIGATPNLTGDLTAAKTITLDGDRIMGTLTIGDPLTTTTTYYAYTLNAGSPVGRLIMDKPAVATALISLPTAANTAANIIGAGILLNDNLEVNIVQTTLTVASLTLGGVIDDGANSYSLKKTGVGLLTLSGANTYDGGTTLSAGRLTASNAASFGTGPVTIEATGAGAVGAEAFLSATAPAGYPNNFTINGIGPTFSQGNFGAMRFQGATTAGSITVASDARISAFSASSGTLNGSLLGNAALELNNSAASFNGTFNLNGDASGYTGALTLSQGRLNLGINSNPGGSVTIKEGITGSVASVGGETNIAGALTLGNPGSTTTGPILYVDPSTSDALHTNGNLTLYGKITVALTGALSGSSATVLTYGGTLTGNASNLDLLGGLAAYRPGTGFNFGVSNEISLTLVTGAVKWTGAATSAWNSADVNWTDGSPTTFYNLDNVTFDETTAAKAAFTTALANTTNNDLVFTAVASGAAGENVMVEYVDPFTPSSPLSVTVSGSTISVSLGTDAAGLITSTATAIKAAVEASGPASALATVTLAAGNDGSGLVLSLNATSLAMTNPAITIASGVTVSPGSMTFDHSAINYSITGTGVIGGGGSLTKSGTGMLTVSTSNTFAGGVTLNSGRLRAGTSSALGSGTFTMTGGQFSSDSTAARSLANASVVSGSLTLGDATDTGGITLLGGCTLAGNTTIDVPTATTISQVLGGVLTDGAGSFSLTKRGITGVLVLSGANTYDGGTFIEGGRVNIGTATSFGTGPVTVYDSGQAYLTLAGPVTNAFVLSGIGFTEATGTHGAIRLTGTTVSGPITLAGDTRITGYGSTGTLSGNIGETGGSRLLELSNYSTATDTTITVSGNNSYSYGTTVKGAIVIANSNTAFGTGPVTIQSNGTAARTTRVQLGSNVVLPVANGFVLDSDAVTAVSAITSYAGDNTTASTAIVNGPVEILKKVGGGGHLASTKGSASVLRVMGPITSPNGVSVVVRQGTVELGGGGTYAAIEVTDGKLKLAATNGLCTSAVLSVATSGTNLDTGTFDLNGFDQTLAGLLKGPQPASVTNSGGSVSTLTLDLAAAATYAGTFADGGSALNVIKSGAGTLTLSGVSSAFTGGLTVTNGGLNLTGNLGTTGATATLGLDTTLSGEGTFGGNLSLSGAIVNVNGSTAAGAYAAGTINATGGVLVKLQSLPATPAPITIIEFGTSLAGDAGNFSLIAGTNYRSPVFNVAANAVSLTLGAPVNLTWTGTGGSDWDTATTSNWTNPALAPSPFYFADNVTFGNTGGGTIGVPASVNAANLVINSNDNWVFQGAGTISAASVTKDGTGSATFETPVNFSGPLTLTAGALRFAPLTGVTTTVAGALSGAGTLVKGGDGTLSLPAASAGFTGSVVISKGELAVGNSTAIGTGTLTFGDAATLPADTQLLRLAAGVAITNPVIVETTALDATTAGAGAISGAATLTKKGDGVLKLQNANTFTGATTIVGGTLRLDVPNAATALAAGSTVTLGSAATGATQDTVIQIGASTATSATVTCLSPITVSNAAPATSKAVIDNNPATTVVAACSSTITLAAGRPLYARNSGQMIWQISGKVTGTGDLYIDNADFSQHRIRLVGTTNDFVGNIYLLPNSGLQVFTGAGGTNNCIPNTADVILAAGSTLGMGTSDTIGALSGTGTVRANLSSSASTVTLTLGANNHDGVYDGTTLSLVGTSAGGGIAITKTGTGTQTFNGVCEHLGATSITGGKLIVNNTYASPITVGPAGTLGGNMTSTAAVTATAAGAKITPGNSNGTMTAASANLTTGGVLDLEIDDAGTLKNDKLVVTGALTVTGSTLNLLPSGTPAAPVYVLASYGTLTGTFGIVTGKPTNYDLVYNYNDGVSSNNIALVKQGDAYLDWLAAYPALTGASRAPGEDFDNDGLDNGVEFVIGSDPTAATATGRPAATVIGGNLEFTFKRSDASEAYAVSVELGTDLATWPTVYNIPGIATSGPVVYVTDNGPTTPDDVVVRVPMAPDTKKFARLKAVIPFTP